MWPRIVAIAAFLQPINLVLQDKVKHEKRSSASLWPDRRYAAGKNISFQARTFCSVPERFVPSVHFWPKYNLNLIN